MKSDVRAMKKWPLFYAILKNSPMMRTGDLEDKLRERVSRSDIYEFLKVYERKEKIIRPTRGLIVLVRKPGYRDRRADRKWLEKERDLQLLDVEYIKILRSMLPHAPNEEHREWIKKEIKRTKACLKNLEALRVKS